MCDNMQVGGESESVEWECFIDHFRTAWWGECAGWLAMLGGWDRVWLGWALHVAGRRKVETTTMLLDKRWIVVAINVKKKLRGSESTPDFSNGVCETR
jgi:hypothetical protein